MKGYAILALFCTVFLAVQCHSHNHKKRIGNGPVYDGLNTFLSEAHEHAALVAEDLSERVNETFTSIKEKVEQLKDNSSYTQQIEVLKLDGEDVQKCLKKHEIAIAQFMRKLVNTYDSCSDEVKQEVNKLVDNIKDDLTTVKGGDQLIEEVEIECFGGEESNIAGATLCVVTLIAEVQERLFEATQSVENFISHSVEDVEVYLTEKCDGIVELNKEFKKLYSEIDACVESI